MKLANSRSALLFSVVVLVVVLCLNVTRIMLQYDEPGGVYERQTMGLFDFHNGVYTPTRAYIDGVNPYGQIVLDRGYPLARPAPFYGPSHFLIHAPIALLWLHAAEITYCVITLVLYFFIVAIPIYLHARYEPVTATPSILRTPRFWVYSLLGVSALLLSRPGHVNFVTAYFTAELALGTIATLLLASRHPWLAGLAFVLVCGKPTYAVPVLILLFILGLYRAVIASVFIGGIFNAVAVWWLLKFDSVSGLLAGIKQGQEQHMADPLGHPTASWVRIDWAAIVAKWMNWSPPEIFQLLIMLLLYFVVWVCLVLGKDHRSLNQAAKRPEFVITSAATLCYCSILLFLYHHVYDTLILVPPVVALLLNQMPWTRSLSLTMRIVLLALLSSPFWNYFSSETFLIRLPESVALRNFLTSWNCIAVTMAAFLLVPVALREIRGDTNTSPAGNQE